MPMRAVIHPDRCTFEQASTIFNRVRARKSLSHNAFISLWDAGGMRVGCGSAVEIPSGQALPRRHRPASGVRKSQRCPLVLRCVQVRIVAGEGKPLRNHPFEGPGLPHFRRLRDRADRTLPPIAAAHRRALEQASTIFNRFGARKSLSHNAFFRCGMRVGCAWDAEAQLRCCPGKRCPGITGRHRESRRAFHAHWGSSAVPGPDRGEGKPLRNHPFDGSGSQRFRGLRD